MNKLGNKVITLPNNFMKKILKDTYNKTINETKILLTNNNYHYKLNTFKHLCNCVYGADNNIKYKY